MTPVTWWQVCAIIFSVGASVFGVIAGVVATVNMTFDAEWINARSTRLRLEIQKLEVQRQIQKEQNEHHMKMISS